MPCDLALTNVDETLHEREDEVFQVLEGQVSFQVGEEQIVGEAGTIVFAPRGIPHSYQLSGDSEACLRVAIFPAGIEKMFEELAELPTDGPPDMEQVTSICGRYGITFLPPTEE